MTKTPLQGVSLNALARQLKRAKSGLSKLARERKIPQLPDGSFDPAAVIRALASNLDPARAKPVTKPVTGRQSRDQTSDPAVPPIATPDDAKDAVALILRVLREEGMPEGEASVVDYAAARTADTILKARQREFALAVSRKKFVPLDAVKAHVSKAFTGYRQAIQRVPARFAAQMAAEVGCDPFALDVAMTKVITTVLDELSAPVVRG